MSTIQFKPQDRKCLVCGSDNLTMLQRIAADSSAQCFVNIVECNDCIFAWQYPLGRTEEESVQHFNTSYEDAGKTRTDYFNPDRKRKIAELEFEFLSKLPAKGNQLLDLGAGAGLFAEVAAEKGYEVTAVDPAIQKDRILNIPTIEAIEGTIRDISDTEKFDIVTLWDVIEHIPDPLELLSDASSHLKKDGWLILETGNYKSKDRLLCGNRHWMYALDHRWYFAPESIVYLLKETGFSEFIFSEKALRPGWSGTVKYAGPSRFHLLKSIVRDPLHLANHFYNHSRLIKAKDWSMPGIGIFAVAARMPNQD